MRSSDLGDHTMASPLWHGLQTFAEIALCVWLFACVILLIFGGLVHKTNTLLFFRLSPEVPRALRHWTKIGVTLVCKEVDAPYPFPSTHAYMDGCVQTGPCI